MSEQSSKVSWEPRFTLEEFALLQRKDYLIRVQWIRDNYGSSQGRMRIRSLIDTIRELDHEAAQSSGSEQKKVSP
jgi:hypothetical protein